MFKKKRTSVDDQVIFNVDTVCEGHHKVTYRGIKAIRCPFDYVIYQMIISELRPDLVIEIGTNIGGGALYIADLMNNIGHGIIHTIDIKNQSDPVLAENPRIKTFTEGWDKYDIQNAVGFEKILVIEDASHMYEDTLAALIKFAPLVTRDSYLIVEDGIIDELGMKEQYNGGPLKAIAEFLKTNKNFVVDRKWCDLFGKNATFNVNGYLRRIN
ncbi:CmcI family methyltransferase [Flavitalea sp.]|nr:CmcI family methyltransferase [Flavitalea sp.]